MTGTDTRLTPQEEAADTLVDAAADYLTDTGANTAIWDVADEVRALVDEALDRRRTAG